MNSINLNKHESIIEQLENLEKLKRKTIQFLENFQEIARNEEKKDFVTKIGYVIDSIYKDKFILSVLAEWNYGKSTFINSLLGEDLLIAKNRETTAAICEIAYGEEKKIKIYFNDKKKSQEFTNITKEKLQEILKKYATTDGEKVEQLIYKLEINYPVELCRNGVIIVDTPGINSLNDSRDKITYDFIPRSDAVIMLIDCEKAGSKGDYLFIEKIKNNKKNNLFFIINKVDQLNDEEIIEAEESLKKALSKIEINDPYIFSISAYYALIGKQLRDKKIDIAKLKTNKKLTITDNLNIRRGIQEQEDYKFLISESKIENLEKSLGKFLAKTDKRQNLLSALNYTSSLLNDIYNDLVQELSSLQGNISLEQIVKAIDILDKEKKKIKETEYEIVEIINNSINIINIKIDGLSFEKLIFNLEHYIDKCKIKTVKTEIKPWLEVECKKVLELFTEQITQEIEKAEKKALIKTKDFSIIIKSDFNNILTSKLPHCEIEKVNNVLVKEIYSGVLSGSIKGVLIFGVGTLLTVPNPAFWPILTLAGISALAGGILGVQEGLFSGINKWSSGENNEEVKKTKEKLKNEFRKTLWSNLDEIKKEYRKRVEEREKIVQEELRNQINNQLNSVEAKLLTLKENKHLLKEEIQEKEVEIKNKINGIQRLISNIDNFIKQEF